MTFERYDDNRFACRSVGNGGVLSAPSKFNAGHMPRRDASPRDICAPGGLTLVQIVASGMMQERDDIAGPRGARGNYCSLGCPRQDGLLNLFSARPTAIDRESPGDDRRRIASNAVDIFLPFRHVPPRVNLRTREHGRKDRVRWTPPLPPFSLRVQFAERGFQQLTGMTHVCVITRVLPFPPLRLHG